MLALRRFFRGALLVAIVSGFGFGFTPPASAEAAEPPAYAEACPLEPGLYLMYLGDELIGVMVVDSDCNARVWLAAE